MAAGGDSGVRGAGPPRGRHPTASVWIGAVAVVGVALLARCLEAILDGSVFNDGPRFVAMAAAFLAGDWRGALSDDFHPLTALAMAATSALLGVELETAGEVVSVLAGGVAAFAIWKLTLDQLGARAALVAGLIFALHPRLRESSAGVQSDGLHLAWFVLAACFAWQALEGRRLAFAALAGLCTGFGYLTRPEALVVGVVLVGWLAADLVQRRLSMARTLALGAAYAVALVAVSSPYVLALHELSGRWSITHKKDLSAWVLPTAAASLAAPDQEVSPGTTPEPQTTQTTPARSTQVAQGTRTALSEVLKDGLRGLHPILLVLAAIGFGVILRGEAHARRAAVYPLSFLLLFLGLLLALHLMAGYVSRRHFLPAAALLVPLAGRGTLALSDAALQRVPRLQAWRAAPALGIAIMLGIFIEMVGPKTEPNKVAREEAAHWLREHHAPVAVAAHRARDAYYAGAARHVALLRDDAIDGSLEAMLHSVHARGAQFVILDLDTQADQGLPPWAHVLHRAKYQDAEVLVLELRP